MATKLPVEFMDALSKLDHFDSEAFLAVHNSGDPLVSVHMNPGKPIFQNGRWLEEITDPPFKIIDPVPWAPDAWYLSERPSFTLDPLFHAGSYYVQEASGMFLAFALKHSVDLSQKLRVLDLCAAPGGKSTMIQSLISQESVLVSNEVIKTRVPVLCQNITKWGNANGFVSNNDPAHFKQLPGFFDLMLIDAPCSGSGLFRKDPDAVKEWNSEAVKRCSLRQQRIITDAWESLKEDGILIYSTCSYSKEENEDILDNIFLQHNCISISLNPDPKWKIVETVSDQAGAHGYRFYPDKLPGEGFFLAVIQKKQSVVNIRINKTNHRIAKIPTGVKQLLDEWLVTNSVELTYVGDTAHGLQPGLLADFEILKNNLYLKKAGIRLGKAGEKEWIPDHELALANFLKEETSTLHLGKAEAIRFLRGEAFETEKNERGWRVAAYQGKRMGWVKLLDKRLNNYYPKSWRIRL